MKDRRAAKAELNNLYILCKEFGQLPSEVLKTTTIDELSFNLFVIREGRPKEGQ